MYRKNINEMKDGDILLVSLEYWLANQDKLKGIPLAITPDGNEPKEIVEEELPIVVPPQPTQPTQDQVIEDLVALLIESGVITNV